MKLLPEFAILLDIFEGSPGATPLRAAYLRESILRDALIRDLHAGAWSRAFQDLVVTHEGVNRKILGELLKALRTGPRLIKAQACGTTRPVTPSEWLAEAAASHQKAPLDAIVTDLESSEPEIPSVTCDELLVNADRLRPLESARVKLQTADFLDHLKPVLDHADLVCFIDPYLTPDNSEYGEFPELVLPMASRKQKPRIELHLKCKQNEKRSAITDCETWRRVFSKWDAKFKAVKLPVRVFVWDKFHNRYLLSNIVSLLVGAGFRTTTDSNVRDDWSRLNPQTRKSVEDEFGAEFIPSSLLV